MAFLISWWEMATDRVIGSAGQGDDGVGIVSKRGRVQARGAAVTRLEIAEHTCPGVVGQIALGNWIVAGAVPVVPVDVKGYDVRVVVKTTSTTYGKVKWDISE